MVSAITPIRISSTWTPDRSKSGRRRSGHPTDAQRIIHCFGTGFQNRHPTPLTDHFFLIFWQLDICKVIIYAHSHGVMRHLRLLFSFDHLASAITANAYSQSGDAVSDLNRTASKPSEPTTEPLLVKHGKLAILRVVPRSFSTYIVLKSKRLPTP